MEHTELDEPTATWLTSPDGLAAVAAATAALDAGQDQLQLASALRAELPDPTRRTAVLAAAVARRRARARWPDADRLLFTRVGLEQASDPAVSAWRASRFAGAAAVEDRAAGLGGDTLALAAVVGEVTAVDLDPARLRLLRHNAEVRDVTVRTVAADALRRPPPRRGAVHLDPARRVGQRRVRRLADHQPSVPAALAHLRPVAEGAGVAVVLSPAVALDDPALPAGAELEFVQRGRDLVESVLWTGGLAQPGAVATATLLDDDGSHLVSAHRQGPPRQLPVGPVGAVLLDLVPAAVRARLHGELAATLGARRLAERRALLTVDEPPPASPWWRARHVVDVLPARGAALRRRLRHDDVPEVEWVRHGLEVDLRALQREAGSPPTGPNGWRVELVRTDEGALAILTAASVPRS